MSFSFIAHELLSSHKPLSSFAILVKDRFQGGRLNEYLHQLGIQTASTTSTPITETLAFDFLKTLFVWTGQVKSMRHFKAVLAHPFLHLPFSFDLYLSFLELQSQMATKGLPTFLAGLIDLIKREDQDLKQTIHLLLKDERKDPLDWLCHLELLDLKDHPYLKRESASGDACVSVMTSHLSNN